MFYDKRIPQKFWDKVDGALPPSTRERENCVALPLFSAKESQLRHNHAFNELGYLHDITFGRRPGTSEFIVDLSDRLWSDRSPDISIRKIVDYFDLKRATMNLNGVICYGSFGSDNVHADIAQGHGEVFILDMYSINEHRNLSWPEIEGLSSVMGISHVPIWKAGWK